MVAYPIGIVGESFDNDDGTSRQAEIARCNAGEPVGLERDPNNKFDKNCVKVVSVRGTQIGNISRDDSWICERMDRGGFVDARILNIRKGKRGYGVVICVRTTEDEAWLEDTKGSFQSPPDPQNVSMIDAAKGCASLIFLFLIVWFLVLLIRG